MTARLTATGRRVAGLAVLLATVAGALPASAAAPAVQRSSVQRSSTVRRSAAVHHVFPVRCASAHYARYHHDYPATDILAPVGCPFVAPVAGRVDEVNYRDRYSWRHNRGADRGGLSVSVVGVDGVRYYGSHLRDIARGIRPGARVAAGALLGHVGQTGDARGTAPHVHFGISWPTRRGVWWVRRGEVWPWPYLDSWRRGGERSPAAEVAAKRRRVGEVPPCRHGC